jgi:predicted HicB family RNase H-like nuclease
MNLLRYKDYQGSVSFEDGRLVIQILHIDDLITAECDCASAAQAVFEELVDDYLATCEELKKEPSKPFKGSLNIRMPPALHKRAAFAAVEAGESINALITRALQAFLEKRTQEESHAAKEKLLLGWLSSQVHSMAQAHRDWETFARWVPPSSAPAIGRIRVLHMRTKGGASWTKLPVREVQ